MRRSCTLVLIAALSLTGCERGEQSSSAAPATPVDTMGRAPTQARAIAIRGAADLVESSAAAMSTTQSGIWFTINDSGHEPVLFAFDTTGAAVGRWLLRGAKNRDWESASYGPCGDSDPPPVAGDTSRRCIYVGDTGDNDGAAASRAIYRVVEPRVREDATPDGVARGSVSADRLAFRYPDGPHDVEAMYVAPDASVYLITKRPLLSAGGRLRPALVFRLSPQAWSARGVQQAELVDSLPIVPGSAFARFITDASLSPDAKYLAVRTYTQVYILATDSATGRVRADVPPAVCNIVSLDELQGEGVAWLETRGRLLLTSEGRGGPFHIATCPIPR